MGAMIHGCNKIDTKEPHLSHCAAFPLCRAVPRSLQTHWPGRGRKTHVVCICAVIKDRGQTIHTIIKISIDLFMQNPFMRPRLPSFKCQQRKFVIAIPLCMRLSTIISKSKYISCISNSCTPLCTTFYYRFVDSEWIFCANNVSSVKTDHPTCPSPNIRAGRQTGKPITHVPFVRMEMLAATDNDEGSVTKEAQGGDLHGWVIHTGRVSQRISQL